MAKVIAKILLAKSLSGLGALRKALIVAAFKKVDRADFVLPEYLSLAYEDCPLPIGFGQTISQPFTVALMLEWLAPKKKQKILDIGCGSGWTTALLSSIVGKKGRVIGIERIPKLAKFGRDNLKRCFSKIASTSLPAEALAKVGTIVRGDASEGYAKEAPYDRILASASGSKIPDAWKEQLKVGGRIVAPVKDSVVVIDRLSRGKYQKKSIGVLLLFPSSHLSLPMSRGGIKGGVNRWIRGIISIIKINRVMVNKLITNAGLVSA